MRRGLWLATLLLPLCGCYVPSGEDYIQPGYPAGAYPQAAYPAGAYAPPPYDPYAGGYPGYAYSNGPPMIIEGGAPQPLVLFGGEWGYHDHDHHWHRAPDDVARHWNEQRAGGFRQNAPPQPGYNGQPGFNGRPDRQGFQGHQNDHPAPAAFVAPHPAPPSAPQPAPQPAQHEADRHHNCPPGQRC